MRYTYYNIVSLILKGIRTNLRPDKFSVRTNLRPDKSQFVVLHGGKILRSCVPWFVSGRYRRQACKDWSHVPISRMDRSATWSFDRNCQTRSKTSLIGNQHEFHFFLYFLLSIYAWKHVWVYFRAQMLLSVLLRVQKRDRVRVNIIALKLEQI